MMLINISGFFSKNAKGWLVLLMMALFFAITTLLFPGVNKAPADTEPAPPVDILFYYTPEEVYDLVDSYGPDRRASYRTFELTVDILYPIVYTILLGLTISWLFQRGFKPESKLQYLNVLPVGAGLFDLFENLSIVGMLSIHPARPSILAWAATVFTMIKWSVAYISIGLLFVGLLGFLVKRIRQTS